MEGGWNADAWRLDPRRFSEAGGSLLLRLTFDANAESMARLLQFRLFLARGLKPTRTFVR